MRSRIEVLRSNVADREAAEAAAAEREAAHEAEREQLIAAAEAVDATPSDVGIALMIGGGVGLLASIGPIVWVAQRVGPRFGRGGGGLTLDGRF